MRDKECRYDLPLDPPDGLFDWMVRTGLIDKSIITYKMEYHQDDDMTSHRDVRCTCCACEKSFYAKHIDKKSDDDVYGWQYGENEPVYHGERRHCPMCGEIVTVQYIGKRRNSDIPIISSGAVTVERIDGHIAVIWWRAELVTCGSGVERRIYPWEAYVFDGRRCVKNVAYDTYGFFRAVS